ncbi:MAG TPA: bifunctional demethylmenaquinone methyltransferase/2-methoxy-6-polyprenyl-1,4-benzoquinol methylase UbiE [Myxococcales bacterium LLY-WYZ-16_1]|jgi:demethylmenaquinone methyltransferase / 2-methoxy-6-polyprenyl-1,4-benzoquinol methylase|nr:bifunctional demethylmenaquinone methyltransferase/2-methoxy-6-polyprenyl-1,4-benzoquinol methylase UbiE [Myxococcales bacterium LLY-WYZ-16_1]
MTANARADGSGQMFDGIAHRYDLLNRINSFGMDRGWRRSTVDALQLPERARVLDLATGTADLALELVRRHPDAQVVGVDPSDQMLGIGRRKVRKVGDRIRLENGDAQALRFEDESFDGVMMAFGIRNVPDRAKALEEMFRVLRPGGRVAILELSEPQNGLMAWFARQHVKFVVPLTGALLVSPKEYRYLRTSIEAFPRPEAFEEGLRQVGFDEVGHRAFTFGACVLYLGRRPA